MRTTISIDSALLAEADGGARARGLTRSQLIEEALRQFIDRESVTERLNQAYSHPPDPSERQLVRTFLAKLPEREPW